MLGNVHSFPAQPLTLGANVSLAHGGLSQFLERIRTPPPQVLEQSV